MRLNNIRALVDNGESVQQIVRPDHHGFAESCTN